MGDYLYPIRPETPTSVITRESDKAYKYMLRAEAAAFRAEEAAIDITEVSPSYSEGDVLAVVSSGNKTKYIYSNVNASDINTLYGNVSSLSTVVDNLSAIVGQANAILEEV